MPSPDDLFGVKSLWDTTPKDREYHRKHRTCERCDNPIPTEENFVFYETGLCGYCAHMVAKAKNE